MIFAAGVLDLQTSATVLKWLDQVKLAKEKGAFLIFLYWRHDSLIVCQLQTVSLFPNRDSKIAKSIPSSSSSFSSVTSRSFTLHIDSIWSGWTIWWVKRALPFSHWLQRLNTRQRWCITGWFIVWEHFLWNKIAKNTAQRMVLSLVGNTMTRDAIESYTAYDITGVRPRKTTRAFLAIFHII